MKLESYTRLHLWLWAHRRVVLGITLLIVAAAIVISSRITLEENILAILPKNDRIVDEYRYTLHKFRQIDRVYIDVGIDQTNSPVSADQLSAAADEVYAQLSANTNYARILYRLEYGGQQKIVDYLAGALPNLFTPADVRALAAKLEPASVREHLTFMRHKLEGLEGMVLKDVVAADPIGMSTLVVAKVLPLQTGFGDAQIVDGRITSRDGNHILIMAEPVFSSSDSRNSVLLVADMLRIRDEVQKQFPGVHVAITGGHRMSVDNASLIKADATRCILLGFAAMLTLCITAYRRKWMAIITFLPSLFGTLMAGVVLVFWDSHLSAIATGFATIAIGITVDYGIYVVYHLDNGVGLDRISAGRIISRLVTPTFIGALTIIGAFVVLAGSSMQGYQQLGLFGAIGVLMSAAFALLILPLLVPLAKEKDLPQLRFTYWMETFHAWQRRWRPWLLLGLVVVTVITAFGIKRLRFDGDITRLNGITPSTRQDEALIRQVWGGALSMTLVVARGPTEDAALAQDDRAAQVLAGDTNVAGVYSLASVCPSLATQQANIQRWHDFWTPARQAALHQTIAQVGGELGFRPDAFAPFWKTVDGTPPMLTLQMFKGTPLEQALNERVAFGTGTNETAISTLIKLKDRSLVGELRSALPGMIIIDQKDFANHIAGLAKAGMLHFVLWSVIVVGVIVYLALASIEVVVATLLPLFFGLFWALGLMGLFGLPIDMMNCVFVIFIIGIGEDYSVFLATSKLDEWRGHPPRIHATSASVMISALTTICGFAVLVFAKHPVLFSMGTTVLLGMMCAFAATLVLTPTCMDLLLFKNPPMGAPRWWHLLGTLWCVPILVVTQTYVFGVMRPFLKRFSPANADRRVRQASQRAMSALVKPFPFGKVEYQNLTAETFARPAIVISNHQSAVDVLVAFIMSSELCMTVKKRVYETPILGIACQCLGHVMIEPKQPAKTLANCRQRLNAGLSLHFFPEGTRSPDGFVQRFHRGAFELAVELQSDILPAVLCDTNTAMPRDAYWFEPYHATVRLLPRVTPQNFDYTLGSTALMKHCEKIVRDSLQQQLDAVNTPRVVRRKVNRLYRYLGKFPEEFVRWKMKLDPVFNVLDGVVPRSGFVLDLGCGYGVATHWLACFTDGRSFLGVDYDDDKIRVARRTVPEHPRIRFEVQNVLEWDYPACDTILLLDVLHYWTPDKQQLILDRAWRALRPGGRLILRDAAQAEGQAHRRVDFWEKIATRIGHNRTVEGLHFQTRAELEAMLQRAGFTDWKLQAGAGRDSNVLLVATVGP